MKFCKQALRPVGGGKSHPAASTVFKGSKLVYREKKSIKLVFLSYFKVYVIETTVQVLQRKIS